MGAAEIFKSEECVVGRPREISPDERREFIRRGYRAIEVWVPDSTNTAYLQEAKRQATSSVEADRQAGVVELIDEETHRDWDKP